MTNLTVLTFNTSLAPFLWHPYKRIGFFANRPEVKDADIINLQEVHTYDMLYALRHQMSGLHVAYECGLIGPRAGLVTFSRRPISLQSFTALPGRKGILISQKDGIVIANAHLIAHTDGDWSPLSPFYLPHKEQLTQLQAVLPLNEKAILSGDFNLAKSCDLYEQFLTEGGWNDTGGQDTSPTFHKDFLPSDREPQRIDYIFTRGNVITTTAKRVFEDKIGNIWLSNHMGLLVEVEV